MRAVAGQTGEMWQCIECEVHLDGPEAHIDRHLALRRNGWEFFEAYRSRWGDRRAELIVNLVDNAADR